MKSNTVILLFFFFACSSNKQLQFDKSNCNFNDKILENEKKLDFELINKTFIDDGHFIYEDNDSIHQSLEYGTKENYWKRKENKNTHIEKIIAYNRLSFIVENSFSFYNKGNFNIGNEYIYNEQGQVIKTIDHNQYNKYPICYKEISNIILKKAGPKYTLHALYRDSTKIDENKYKYSWNVYIDPVNEIFDSTKINSFKVDAVTGEIIKKWITISTPD